METLGKWLTVAGLLIVVAGLFVWALGKLGFRRLPGDIAIERENVSFYFPIVTCLVVSAVLTLILWIVSWIRKG